MAQSNSNYTSRMFGMNHMCIYLPAEEEKGRDRTHSYHLLPSPSLPRNEDKGGSFSWRQEQSVFTVGPLKCFQEATFGPCTLKKQKRHHPR